MTLQFLFLCSQIVVIVLLLAIMESSRMRAIRYRRLRDNLDIGDGAANPCGQTEAVDDNSLNRVCDYGVNESKPVQFRPDVQSILSRHDTPTAGLNATNHERGSAAQEFETK